MNTSPTLIECLLKRIEGTVVYLDDVAYHFTPDEFGRHTASVSNLDHASTLLAIPEAYQLVDVNDEPTASEPSRLTSLNPVELAAARMVAAVAGTSGTGATSGHVASKPPEGLSNRQVTRMNKADLVAYALSLKVRDAETLSRDRLVSEIQTTLAANIDAITEAAEAQLLADETAADEVAVAAAENQAAE